MKKYALILSLLSVPLFAQADTNLNLSTLIEGVIGYLNLFLVLIMAFAVFMFIFYVIKYFIVDASSDNKKEASLYVMYSVIGFFIIFSFWGLVNILQNTFNLDNSDNSPSSWNDVTNIFPDN